MSDPFTIYFAGELFSLKHLSGNAQLAEALERLSNGRYRCIVPQDLEQRGTTHLAIRNQDLLEVIRCDLALFNFDGPELDSGTVVEFMAAKFLDIPAVILRTDFRRAGDSGADPWNLMASGYPRSEIVTIDGMAEYQRYLRSGPGIGGYTAAQQATDALALTIIERLDLVRGKEPVLPVELRESVYSWFRLFPGSQFDTALTAGDLSKLVERKISRGLL